MSSLSPFAFSCVSIVAKGISIVIILVSSFASAPGVASSIRDKSHPTADTATSRSSGTSIHTAAMPSTKKRELFEDSENSSDSDSDSSSSSSSGDSNDSSSSSSEEEDRNGKNANKQSSTKKPSILKVNESFAKEYTSRKQQQELQNNRDLVADDSFDEDSSSDEEDEDLDKPELDLQFFQTMNALRNKDQSIYDPSSKFFQDGDNTAGVSTSKTHKIKDMMREQILDKMEGVETAVDDGGDDNDGTRRSRRIVEEEDTSRFAYDEQQRKLRQDLLKGINDNDADGDKDSGNNENDDDDDDLLVQKKKNKKSASTTTPDETEQKLRKEIKNAKKSSSVADKDFVDPRGEIQDGQAFLLEYLSNKKWKDDFENDANENNGNTNDDDNESTASSTDKADEFEAKYNFRFEEAATATGASGADFSIRTYARGNQMNTLRRKDDTRKQKRLARKERKAAQRKAKEEQLKRLKSAKKAELHKKLEQVKSILGPQDAEAAAKEAATAIDETAILKMLEGDYDPEKFEQAMKDAYNDDFYAQQDGEWKKDKDVRDAMLQDANALDSGVTEETYAHQDEGGENYNGGDDADGEEYYNDQNEGYDEDGDAQHDTTATPKSHLEVKLEEKVQDELYKLDYEDIIAGDLPTRFKYRPVEKNRYGLSTEEILFAKDKTLKQYVSVKYMAPYRDEHARDGTEFKLDRRRRKKFRDLIHADMDELVEAGAAPAGAADGAGGANAEEKKRSADEPIGGGKRKQRRRLKKGKKKSKVAAQEDGNAELKSEA